MYTLIVKKQMLYKSRSQFYASSSWQFIHQSELCNTSQYPRMRKSANLAIFATEVHIFFRAADAEERTVRQRRFGICMIWHLYLDWVVCF